jgi:cytoskeletal protein CcmA (bactofilin family)
MRGTLMVSGTLRIDGDFEGDILNCERVEVGPHGVLRADVEVRDALVEGRVLGSIRAVGGVTMKSGAHVDGDVAASSVAIEPGVHFNGRCSMTEGGAEPLVLGSGRLREDER